MIDIICLGKIKETYLTDLINDYEKRISKYTKICIKELKDNPNILVEEEEIIKSLDKKSFVILLDINGIKTNSVDFAKLIDKTFINYPKITFIIGGSDGVTDKVKDMANLRLSFSDLTFPHGLFRGVLLEQIYRSFKINNNESYHK